MSNRVRFTAAVTACAMVMMLGLPRTNAAEEKSRKLSDSDIAFIMKANEGGDAEVALGKLAETNGYSTEVKAFGKRMVEDHTKANDQLVAIAKDKDVQLSHELKGETKEMYDKLAKLNGPDFDKQYIHHMIKDHEEDAALFRKEANSGDDTKVKEFAANTVKVIEEHLALANEIATKVGAKIN